MSAALATSPCTPTTVPRAPCADRLDRLIERLAPARHDGDIGAASREPRRDREADALAAAGDHGRAAGETDVHSKYPVRFDSPTRSEYDSTQSPIREWTMEFTALFLAVTVVMLVAWWGSRRAGARAVLRRVRRIGRDLPAPRDRRAQAVVLGARHDAARSPSPSTRSASTASRWCSPPRFAAQLALGELPCPLCLLQRIQFAMLAIGPILNLRFGPRPSHYALSLLAAVAGAAFAARQVLLHILPGDPGYGSALLGYHYYTWAFIGFAAAIVAHRGRPAVRRAVRTRGRAARDRDVSRAARCGW